MAYAHFVAGTWARAGARERIEAICAAPLDARNLRRQVLAVLREVIDFDAYVWLLTDPVTAVGAAPLAEVPCISELPAVIKAKYATAVNRWTILQQQASPARLLSDATDGEKGRNRPWRDVLSRYGIGDVASAVFADQFGCWGFLDLWRAAVGGPYAAADAEFIASVAAPLSTALRRCQARTFVEPATAHRHDTGPVVLMLDDDLRIASRTAASQAWLDVLLPPEPDERAIPASVYNVAAQLLATEQGIDAHPASTRTHLADGFWLTLRAARLSADEPSPGAPQAAPQLSSSPLRRHLPPSAWSFSAAPSASAPANISFWACLLPAATRARWRTRWPCPSTRFRTTLNRSSPRLRPAIVSPSCPALSAQDLRRTVDPSVAPGATYRRRRIAQEHCRADHAESDAV
jgi:hypothetical protein